MSYRYGTQLVPGAYHYGGGGLGVLGSLVPSEGTSGPSLLFGDITLPAEADDEFRTLVTVAPVGLTLWQVLEDGSFLAEGADGVYIGTREGFKNGVSYGTATFTLQFGNSITISLSVTGTGGAFTGTSNSSVAVTLETVGYSGTFAGSAFSTTSVDLIVVGGSSSSSFEATVPATANTTVTGGTGLFSGTANSFEPAGLSVIGSSGAFSGTAASIFSLVPVLSGAGVIGITGTGCTLQVTLSN